MASNLHTLKIQVPAPYPAPPMATPIGELAAGLLAAIRAGSEVLASARPGGVRAQLLHSAAETGAPISARTKRFSKLSMKAWDH